MPLHKLTCNVILLFSFMQTHLQFELAWWMSPSNISVTHNPWNISQVHPPPWNLYQLFCVYQRNDSTSGCDQAVFGLVGWLVFQLCWGPVLHSQCFAAIGCITHYQGTNLFNKWSGSCYSFSYHLVHEAKSSKSIDSVPRIATLRKRFDCSSIALLTVDTSARSYSHFLRSSLIMLPFTYQWRRSNK